MRAAIYNPYLDTLGGGERYSMAFAASLRNLGYDVDVEWNDASIARKLENKFGIDLSSIKFTGSTNRGDGYDVMFWVSDGSVPVLKARKNFIHFQVPFTAVNGRSLFNKMKFLRIDKVICNSFFTKKIIDSEYGIKSFVLYPPVDVDSIKPKTKENIIVSVGRFSQLTQAKHQDVLVAVYKNLFRKKITDWRLILAGGSEVGVGNYVNKLRKSAVGFPIFIEENPSFKRVKELLGKAKIFWSAAGFGVDEQKEPSKVEHFGIAVVEAMAGGAAALAYKAGGHKETINDGVNGYLWKTKGELAKKTEHLVSNPKLLKSISLSGVKQSAGFSYAEFDNRVKELMNN